MQRVKLGLSVLLVATVLLMGVTFARLNTVHAEGGLDPQIIQDRGVAPELTNDTWINSDKPLRLADLRGKVVLLDFWTFGCYNCQNTLPYIKDDYAKYKPLGVEFIGIHFPETAYEHDVNNVRQYVKDNGITYPVAIDNDGKAWNDYEMHAWPAFIIVDKAGHIRYRQIGEGSYDTIAKVLDTLNAEPAPENVSVEKPYKMSDNPLLSNTYGAAPELTNDTWINSDKPLRLADLHGKVVLLEFWTFGCYNCKNTLPAMKSFQDKYSDKGLVIIGDHFPEFGYERELANVQEFVKTEGIKYAVALDNDGAVWGAYHQRYWPTMYLIDKRGQIRYVAIGEHDYSRTEEAINALLSE
ncbi:MAG: redoxin domain-containing protein [Chloroflexota bacterium]